MDERGQSRSADIECHTIRKITQRVILFLVLVYSVNFLDPVNIGFVALQMNKDLGFTLEVYGFAAGILFVGYTLFAVPSNSTLKRIGAIRELMHVPSNCRSALFVKRARPKIDLKSAPPAQASSGIHKGYCAADHAPTF
jgi:hypothetical protein